MAHIAHQKQKGGRNIPGVIGVLDVTLDLSFVVTGLGGSHQTHLKTLLAFPIGQREHRLVQVIIHHHKITHPGRGPAIQWGWLGVGGDEQPGVRSGRERVGIPLFVSPGAGQIDPLKRKLKLDLRAKFNQPFPWIVAHREYLHQGHTGLAKHTDLPDPHQLRRPEGICSIMLLVDDQ